MNNKILTVITIIILSCLFIAGCGEEKKAPLTPEQKLTNSVQNIPKSNSDITGSNASIKDDPDNPGMQMVNVTIDHEMLPGLEKTAQQINYNVTKIFKDCFTSGGNYSQVNILVNVNLEDVYGNVDKHKTAEFMMSNETAKKINWTNFNSSNLPKVADKVWWSDGFALALRDEIFEKVSKKH